MARSSSLRRSRRRGTFLRLCITQGMHEFAALCPYSRKSVLILLFRVKDWLYGVCQTAPVKDPQGRLNRASLTEAERLRIVYLLITNPCSEGGAGITPNEGDWQEVDAIFPLHDHVFNKEWLKHWSTRYFLSIDDLTKIRDHYGEKARSLAATEMWSSC